MEIESIFTIVLQVTSRNDWKYSLSNRYHHHPHSVEHYSNGFYLCTLLEDPYLYVMLSWHIFHKIANKEPINNVIGNALNKMEVNPL